MATDGEKLNPRTLTDEQRRALTARGVSVALSAGAGCGKTFVLTERFMAELSPDEPASRPRLGQLVAITFTERAAREMRDRIRTACRCRLLECPESQADYWLELLRDLDSARISTIHSFCASLLRAHAVEAGIDPRFRVLDAAQSATLLFELTDDVLRDRLADRSEAALALATRVGLDRLRDMIARLLAMRQQIDWSAWQRESPEGLVARWQEFWQCDTVPRVLRRISDSAAAQILLDVAMRYPPAPPKMRERCDFLLQQIPRLPESTHPADDLMAVREAAKVQGGATIKSWGNESAFERFRDAAKDLRDAISNVVPKMQFDATKAMPAAAIALQLLGLTADMAAEYERKKKELGVLDFNDLLIHARDLLVGPESAGLRKRLAAQMRLLLVDEFQDTDPLQVETIKALCDNEHLRGKLFFVGDHKQSIYRFRGAQPHVFRQLRAEVPDAGQLPLSLNFRSQPAVIEFVNALMADELGPDYEPLRAQRPQVGPAPAVEFLWAHGDKASEASALDSSDSDEDVSRRERNQRREADWIGRRIRAMLDAGEEIVWDEEAAQAGRPAVRTVRQGDIALLFRALTSVEYYEEALRRYGIDYYLVGGHAFYAQQEIYDLLNLLRTVNSPCDEVSLAGALRSPMFGLLDETLLWLSHADGLAAGLFADELPEVLNEHQRRRAEFAAATIRELRFLKDRLPVARLIYEALDRTGYDAMLLAEFLGQRKLANLHKLIEQARGFDAAGIFTLADFINQLAEFVARQPDEPLAATHSESTNVVRLMTIHQAKGLEFPVVVVPDVGRSRRAAAPPVAFTPQLGPMLKDNDATTGYDFFAMVENEEDMAESSRLLYVAATRAADYLIFSAGMEQPGKITGPWMELLARHFDLQSGELKSKRASARSAVARGSGGSPPSSPEPRTPNPESRSLVTVITDEPTITSKPVDLMPRRDLMKIVEKARKMAEDGAGRRAHYLESVPCDVTARQQFSFSRLTGRLHVRSSGGNVATLGDDAQAAPALDPRQQGTLVHAVLAEIDFAQPNCITELLRRHAIEHLPEASDRLDEPARWLERFLASPRATEIAAAQEVHRELEFLLAWMPEESIDADVAGELAVEGFAGSARHNKSAPQYFQGYIDCLYRDAAGQWRLVDYKTNDVTADNLAAVAGGYELQMLVYALAVERILKTPPAELTLCFLRPGLEYRFIWDAAARQRAAGLIDAAMSSPLSFG